MECEFIGVEEIAVKLHLSAGYVRNNWLDILPGLRPRKTRSKQRKLLFLRNEFDRLILQAK
jgi:hypothetical protein